jgi:tetraspanin-33
MVGVCLILVGLWAHYDKYYADPQGLVLMPTRSFYSYILDLTNVMIVLGCVVFVISLIGCVGVLRENIILIKIVSCIIYY